MVGGDSTGKQGQRSSFFDAGSGAGSSFDRSNFEAMGLSNKEIRKKMMEEYERRNIENFINKKLHSKEEAVKDYIENGFELVATRFNFMEDENINALRLKRKREFESKVQTCLESIHKYDNEFIDTMFEPKVIMEVTNKVYDKMISTSEKTIK